MQNSNSIPENQQELQKLYNSVGPNLITLYKTYLIYYANWCKDNNLLSKYSDQFKPSNTTPPPQQPPPQTKNEEIDNEAVIYKHLPISSHLIHKFLIDTIIKRHIGLDHNNDILQSLSKWIMGLIFITKLCRVYGNLMVIKTPIDENYLYKIIELHKYAHNSNTQIPIYQISINSWNSNTKNLNPIHFKTANEKLRFLVDFHFTTYLRLNFEERSNLKLCSLITTKSNTINIHIPGSHNKLNLIYYYPRFDKLSNQQTQYKDTALLPHQSPFLCPYTSLAASLFLRFYGILYFSKGEGFPDLYDEDYIKNMPLITNKFNNEYPKETAISICYSTMFKYCSLPYKKRAYFETLSPVFPTWDSVTSYDKFKNVFPHDEILPWDYVNILNGFDPYVEKIDFHIGMNSNIPSQDIISSFFPEIEKYKTNSRKLSKHSQNFIQLLETIRTKFVHDLPVIYKIFPEHDIFINPIFKDPKIQYYLNGIQLQDNEPLPFEAKLSFNNNGEDKTTLFDLYKDLTDQPPFLSQLEETNSEVTLNTVNVPSMTSSFPLKLSGGIDIRRNIKSSVTINNQDELLEELRTENFKFIQYQTLYNFESFVELVGKIFNRLSLKESSKLEIERAMEHYKSLLNKKIQESTPDDIKEYFIKNPAPINTSQQKTRDIKSESDSDSDLDSDNDSENRNAKTKKPIQPFKVFSVGGESSDEEGSGAETSKLKSKRTTVLNESSNISEEEEDVEEDDDNEDQEEQLKDMIDELVTTKVEMLLKRQMEVLESKLERIVDDVIETKLERKFDFFIENRMKRTVENYMRENEIDTNPAKRVKKSENSFAQRVQHRTAALSETDAREDEFQDTFQSEISVATPTRIRDENSTNELIRNDSKSEENDSPNTSSGFAFHMTPLLDKIEDIILEWFSPNPTMNNECIHSMNRKYGKTWRLKHDEMYRIRKNIVDFYVYLTNIESVDKLQAISYCKNIQGDRKMDEFSKFLRSYKKSHDNTFEGLYQP